MADGSVLFVLSIMDLVHAVGHSPVFQLVLQTEVRTSTMASPPALTNFAGMLSTPASVFDFCF